ncbi:MAG TPA: PhzF family phenazine biosynthesis protein [Pyrinomonadaceae bacterium]|nr:PhzF family phenazine biosynthesis protein [Pyrinomonadaceae bacterium]
MKYRFVQLDVFTDQAFCGNPLAVFPEAEGLTDERMQQIAREMNLSETVFVLPPEDETALRRLRIFTPSIELPFAGHPVVGTWFCLAREGVVPLPENGSGWTEVKQEVGIGVLPVAMEFQEGEVVRVVMTQGKFEIRGEIDDGQEQAEIARGLGLAREDLDEGLPIQAVTTGNMMMMVPVRSLADLGHCKPNLPLLDEIIARNDFAGARATGWYAFTRETIEVGEARAHARFFVGMNIGEDPATGSAAGPLGGYLVYHDAAGIDPVEGVYKFGIEQGDFIKRPSRIAVEVRGGPGKVEEIRVSGTSVVVARGELQF